MFAFTGPLVNFRVRRGETWFFLRLLPPPNRRTSIYAAQCSPITTSNCGDKTKDWNVSRADGERSPVARRLTYRPGTRVPCTESHTSVRIKSMVVILRWHASVRAPSNDSALFTRGGLAAANCALYTIVALSRLTPIDLLSLYKVTQNNVINCQSPGHC